jgi:hypothetical protein
VPALVLATIGAAVLARRCMRGQAPAWTLPMLSFAWIIVATLLRPSVTPDPPWASRRLVPGVLPGLIVLALWAISWLTGWLRQRGVSPALRGTSAVILAGAMIIPAVITDFGLSLHTGGPGGIRLTADGLADKVTFGGEVAAVHRMCAAIPPGSSVLFVGGDGLQLAPVVRGVCGEPAALVPVATSSQVRRLVASIQRAGRRPVLVGATAASLEPFGSHPRLVMRLRTQGDAHTLVTPPLNTFEFSIDVWMSEFPK